MNVSPPQTEKFGRSESGVAGHQRKGSISTINRTSQCRDLELGGGIHRVGAENAIQGPHAASSYSWMRPPSLSVLSWSGEVRITD